MMTARAPVFGPESDFDVSGFAPEKKKERPPTEKVRQVSEKAEFKSREPEQKRSRREKRQYRTGRDTQFSLKADPKVIEEFYGISDQQNWVLGETLERAIEALKKEIGK